MHWLHDYWTSFAAAGAEVAQHHGGGFFSCFGGHAESVSGLDAKIAKKVLAVASLEGKAAMNYAQSAGLNGDLEFKQHIRVAHQESLNAYAALKNVAKDLKTPQKTPDVVKQ